MINNWIKSILVLAGVLTLSAMKSYAAVPGDYDGDGRADLALIDADEPEDKTTIFVRRSSDGTTVPHVFFPFGDFIVAGNFFGNGKTYPGIVSIRSSAKVLQWRIKNPLGMESVFNFGMSTDIPVNPGDLDCDGTDDLVLTRNVSGYKVWYAILSSNPTVYHSTLFGEATDKAFTADTTGDGCREIVVLRGTYDWYSRGFFSNSFTKVQWGQSGDIPLTPSDVNADGVPDYIVVRPASNGKHNAYIRFGANSSMVLPLGSSKGIPFTGDFFSLGDVLGWFDRSKGQITLRYPNSTQLKVEFGNARRGIVRPDGTVVTEEEDGSFATGPTSNGGSDDEINCAAQIRRNDGSGGFVYNPVTSKGTAKVVLPSSYNDIVDNVTAYQGGDKLETLRYAGFEVRDRRRWYFTKKPSAYPEDILIVVKMETGQNRCVTIPDPEKRYD